MDKPAPTIPMANMSILIVLAVVVGGWILSQPKLESGRPPEVSVLEDWAFGDENIKARLWVDPFAAVQRHIDKESSKKGETEDTVKRKGGTIDFDGVKIDDLRIIPVMVDGGTYRESGERRLRTRYAVVSALGVAGYVPVDVDHIGYMSMKSKRADDQPPNGAASLQPEMGAENLQSPNDAPFADEQELIIPFEWFGRSTLGVSNVERSDRVLVLWLRDNAFGDRPLWRLKMLIHELTDQYNPENTGATPGDLNGEMISAIARQMSVIGPAGSETLGAMVKESHFFRNRAPTRSALNGIKLYSPWSTAPEPLLLQRAWTSPEDSNVKGVAEALATAGVEFIRTVCSDDELMDRLAEELDLRGVQPGTTEEDDHVILISELDRFYGRVMPVTFAAAVAARQPEPRAADTSSGILAIMEDQHLFLKDWGSIHHFNYLRGVDRGGADDITEAGSDSTTDGDSQAGKKNRVEQPFGSGQVDYIRRLAGRIVELDREHEQEGKGRVKAIGVLGGDVYDKILILQALRSEFSDAIFFTTDLDARLIHPDQYRWTRNLVIASSYGFSLNNDSLESTGSSLNLESVPPSREGYQTAVFISCLKALGELRGIGDDHTPQLFEVARSGAYDITFKEDKGIIHPPRDTERPDYRLFLLGVMAAGVATIPVLLHGRKLPRLCAGLEAEADSQHQDKHFARVVEELNTSSKRQFKFLGLLAGITVLGVVVFIIVLAVNNREGKGEPFAIFEGVSIWPTEFIRGLILLLGGYFLISGSFRIQRSNIQLSWEFAVSERPLKKKKKKKKKSWAAPRSASWTQRIFPLWMRNMFTPFWGTSSEELGREESMNADILWPTYLRRGHALNRFIRVGALVVLYLIFAVTLAFMSDDPHVPYRGMISGVFDKIMLWASVIMTVSLTFFVVDATILCNRFITLLAFHHTKWPSETKVSTQVEYDPKKTDANNLAGGKWKKILDPNHVDWYGDWLDIKMIAERTKAIGRLVVYPFVLLFFMILSRNSYFDDWDWPISLILILGVMLSYAIYCAFSLRRTAESARQKAIIRLRDQILHVVSLKKKNETKKDEANRQARVDNIKLIIERIQSIRTGAFAPLTHHPILAALALPLGGVGTFALIDMLNTM